MFAVQHWVAIAGRRNGQHLCTRIALQPQRWWDKRYEAREASQILTASPAGPPQAEFRF